MISAQGISVVRNGQKILDNVSVSLSPARVTALIGPNGAGKSTLLRVMTGELQPSSGVVMIDKQPLPSMSAAMLAARRAVVSQSVSLSFPFSAREVVKLGATVPAFNLDHAALDDIVERAVHALELTPFADRYYSALSGGERQRVHVARAYCQLAAAAAASNRKESRAILLDEPTASLDLRHQLDVLSLVRALADSGLAVLLVIHDLNLAAAIADDIVLMSEGRVAAKGAPKVVFDEALLARVYGLDLTVTCGRTGDRPTVVVPDLAGRLLDKRAHSGPHNTPAALPHGIVKSKLS